MPFVFSALLFLLMIAALADIITRDSSLVKHLPKFAWIIIVIVLPLVGSILWFLVGHDYGSTGETGRWTGSATNATPNVSSSSASRARPVVNDTAAELAALEREIERDERAERIRRLEAELENKRRERGAES